MPATHEQLLALAEPTPEDEIKQKPVFEKPEGGGRAKKVGELDYVDARFVMDRLDVAVGPENWQDRYELITEASGGEHLRCGIGILVQMGTGWEWIWKWDVGEESTIEALKGNYSDAFKRAAVKWGIARDLYGRREQPKPKAKRTPKARSDSKASKTTTTTNTDEAEGLTKKQLDWLMANLRKVGLDTSPQRKAFTALVVQKQSVKTMDDADFDKLKDAIEHIDESPNDEWLEWALMVEDVKEEDDADV